ncbi:MAG: transcriptional regulator NrdR [Nanoarchaeota archaeon]
MKCPHCHHPDSKVVDSRESDESVRRRRECLKCEKRFTTYEHVEEVPLMVIKKSGDRQMFSRDKVMSGMIKACEKRPVETDAIHALVDEIETELRNENASEVSTKKIGQLVMKKLRRLDKIAYIRFASVYREFTDLDEFRDEVNRLLKTK